MKNLLLFLIIIPSFAHATTYYVAPNGNDNNTGTISAPFRTWAKLSSVMSAGDIAYIRGGTYTSTQGAGASVHSLIQNLNGNSSNYIIIQNYPGESPVLDLSTIGIPTNQNPKGLVIQNCSYLRVKGLRVTGLQQHRGGTGISFGMYTISSNYIVHEQLEVDNIGGRGFSISNSNDATYLNCDTHHNDDRWSNPGAWGGADGFSGTGGEGSTRTTYEGCRSWWNSDDGWDFYSTDGIRTLKNCWSFWNGYQPGSFSTAGNGEGFKLGPTNTDQSNNITKILTNCLAFENRQNGFSQNTGQTRYRLYNNIAYKNGRSGFWWAWHSGITQDFKNNIGYNNPNGNMDDNGQAQGSYNTWNGGVTVNNADFLSISSVGMDGQRGQNGELPVLNFLKLAQGSDLIDAGIDVGLPFIGSAPDMGPFEFTSAASIPAPVIGAITQPTCLIAAGAVVLSGLPPTGPWTLTRTPGAVTTTGTGIIFTVTGLSAGTYTYTVSNSTGSSVPSANIVINAQPPTPPAPSIGTITQPSCTVATGTLVLNGLPSTGTWTLIRTPGAVTTTGTGTSRTINGLVAGTYSYTVTNSFGCASSASTNIVINTQPPTPSSPVVGTISQPTCSVTTGTVDLSGLPATGAWTLTRTPGAVTTTGTGTSTTVSGIIPGTFTYTVTNASGCTSPASASVVINIPPPTPSAPAVGTITQPSCVVATGDLVLTGLPSAGTWTLTRMPGAVTTTGTGTNITITGLNPGTYTYTVTNASGCSSGASANIIINAQPATPSAPSVGTITQPSCAVPSGSVVLNGLPAGSWTLIRTPGAVTTTGTGTNTTISGITPGTFTYTVTNTSGCTSVASANVIINALPATPSTPAVGAITQPTCTIATGNVVLSNLPATGTWTLTRTPGAVTTTGTGTSTTITGLAAGTYSYTVTNSLGCTSVTSASVVVNTQPPTPSAPAAGTINQPTCAVSTGNVVLNGLPASGTWTLTRTPGAVTTTGTGTNTTITGLAAGTYTFTVSNASGCTSVASANIVINAQPVTPSAPTVGTITQPSCAVPSGSVILNGLPAGSWTLTRTPGNLTTTGTGTNTTISGITPGTFTFTVTNTSGCISGASANVIINALPATPSTPAVGAITQPTCTIATGDVVLSNLPATGTWTLTRTPGAVTTTGTGISTTITGLAAGTYTYTVANASGCISISSASIVINNQPPTPSAPSVGTISQPDCAVATGTVILNGLPASGTWIITRTPGAVTTTGTGTSTTIAGLATGTYTFSVANSSGCTSSNSAGIVINTQPPAASAPAVGTIAHPSCAVPSGSVDLSGLPATGTWTLIRTPGAVTTTGTGTSTTITGLAAGTYTYTVSNSFGCTSIASANVVINAQPATPAAPAAGTITQPTCAVATGAVVLNGLPASGTWTLTRTPGAVTITGTGTSTTITGLAAGTYNFTVSNTAGCNSVSSANIIINTQPATPSSATVGSITQPTCASATGTVILSGLPATGTWTLTRSPGAVATTGTGTSTTINGLSAGTYTYTVTNASGCISAISANVIINAQPSTPSAPVVGNVVQPTGTVLTGTVDLSGLPATGTWTLTRTPDAVVTTGTGTSTSINGLLPGTYSYTVTNATGCVSTASVNVVILAAANIPPVANAGQDTTIILPVNAAQLIGSGSDIDGNIAAYAWKQLSGPSTNVLFSINTATTYANNLIEGIYVFEFTVTDNRGAKGFDTVSVFVTRLIIPAPASQDNSIKIYPNPVVNITTLEINKTNDNPKVIEAITDAQGKTILFKELRSQQNRIIEKIDMTSLPKGIYFVTVIFGNNEKKTLKVIKVK